MPHEHPDFDAQARQIAFEHWISQPAEKKIAAALAAAYQQGRDENGVTLARDALNDESLSDLSARVAAREILAPTPVTAADIAWAESVLRPSRTEEA